MCCEKLFQIRLFKNYRSFIIICGTLIFVDLIGQLNHEIKCQQWVHGSQHTVGQSGIRGRSISEMLCLKLLLEMKPAAHTFDLGHYLLRPG